MSVLEGKSVAILGGSGTVGKAVLRHIQEASIDVDRILIFSRDEIKQLEMMEEFPEESIPKIEYLLGDIRDVDRLEEILIGIDFVIHAAAIKHVVMAEKNPEECHKTNVIGTQNVLAACLSKNVSQCLLISTDKAVNPFGVYGKSKQEAEQLYLETVGPTQFKVIRLGNIIGARGSVFEVFERQKKSGVIKVTHPEATRFCVSQQDAAQYIIEMFENEAQKQFTPEMETFSVLELAKDIAPECEIEIVGLRPGDKLHEQVRELASTKSLRKIGN